MFKIKSKIILLLAASLIILAGCVSESGNIISVAGVPSYVMSTTGNAKLQTLSNYSPVDVPALNDLVKTGDFGVMSFKIDLDQNATKSDYTADLYAWYPAPNYTLKSQSGDMIDDYKDTIKSVEMYSAVLLNKNMFLLIDEGSSSSHRLYDYELIMNTDSTKPYKDSINNVNLELPSLYLKPKITSRGEGDTINYTTYRAMDMSLLIKNTEFQDTIINNIEYKRAKFYMYYQTGTKDGIPVWATMSHNPQVILEEKNK